MSNVYVHFSQISFPAPYSVVNFQLESHSLRFREVISPSFLRSVLHNSSLLIALYLSKDRFFPTTKTLAQKQTSLFCSFILKSVPHIRTEHLCPIYLYMISPLILFVNHFFIYIPVFIKKNGCVDSFADTLRETYPYVFETNGGKSCCLYSRS